MLGFVMKKNEWWKVMNMFARSVMRESDYRAGDGYTGRYRSVQLLEHSEIVFNKRFRSAPEDRVRSF